MAKRNPPSNSELKATLLTIFALVVLTVAAFWPVLSCDFVKFDDPEYVTSNQEVRGGLSLHGMAWAFTTGRAANWHPLTWLSLMLDHDFFGEDPSGYHAVNLALHVANVVLVFLMLNYMTGALLAFGVGRRAVRCAPLACGIRGLDFGAKDVLSACLASRPFWCMPPGCIVRIAGDMGSCCCCTR